MVLLWHKDRGVYSVGDYTPIGFVPGPEDCVLPTLVEQKSRLTAGGTLWRSRDTGVPATVELRWFYWDNNLNKYAVTTNKDDITIDGGTSRPPIPSNPPKAVVTFTDPVSNNTWDFESPQYILTWTEMTNPVPPALPVEEEIVEYVTATPGLRSQINFSEFVTLPMQDDVEEYDSSQDPDIIGHFATSNTVFVDPRIDGKFVLAGAPADPSSIRTGPTYTIANLDSTERYNNTGTMTPLNGLSAYNYATQSWDPYPVD